MNYRDSMRAWILNPYSSILKSYIKNRVELLDMRYLSSYSMLEWLRDHPYKTIRLGQLDFVMDGELNQDLILQSLPESFIQFVVNYHMNKLNTSLPELLNMLKITESHIKKEKAPLLLMDKTSKKKSSFKGSKKALKPKGGQMKKKGKKISG